MLPFYNTPVGDQTRKSCVLGTSQQNWLCSFLPRRSILNYPPVGQAPRRKKSMIIISLFPDKTLNTVTTDMADWCRDGGGRNDSIIHWPASPPQSSASRQASLCSPSCVFFRWSEWRFSSWRLAPPVCAHGPDGSQGCISTVHWVEGGIYISFARGLIKILPVGFQSFLVTTGRPVR